MRWVMPRSHARVIRFPDVSRELITVARGWKEARKLFDRLQAASYLVLVAINQPFEDISSDLYF